MSKVFDRLKLPNYEIFVWTLKMNSIRIYITANQWLQCFMLINMTSQATFGCLKSVHCIATSFEKLVFVYKYILWGKMLCTKFHIPCVNKKEISQ